MKTGKIKYAMTIGLILFAIVVPLTILELESSFMYVVVSRLLVFAGVIVALVVYKKRQTEFKFVENIVLAIYFALFLGLLSGVFEYALFNHINPDYAEVRVNNVSNLYKDFLEAAQTPKEEIERQLEKLNEANYKGLRSPLDLIMGSIFQNNVNFFFVSLVVGIFNRKKATPTAGQSGS